MDGFNQLIQAGAAIVLAACDSGVDTQHTSWQVHPSLATSDQNLPVHLHATALTPQADVNPHYGVLFVCTHPAV